MKIFTTLSKAFLPFALIHLALLARSQEIDEHNLIEHNGEKVFLNGMNLAWMNFANDLTDFNATLFEAKVDSLADAGGNVLRWWLHIDGTSSPQFDAGGKVAGISAAEIAALKEAFDLGFKHGIMILPCLWSFDMLQEGKPDEVYERNRKLLEDPEYTQAYIDNALTPMMKAVGNHPAVVAWEIFNEPEGMVSDIQYAGWTPERVSIEDVQRFINLTASAIHEHAPGALVTNGSWSLRASSDVGQFKNYYSDELLQNAGGKANGVLDFYQVHYYSQHFGSDASPFHNPASHWGLDKPILIGEFPAHGLKDGVPQNIPAPVDIDSLYIYAIQKGYAGVLSWTMTGHDGFGNLTTATPGMDTIAHAYPQYIDWTRPDSILNNHSPEIESPAPDGAAPSHDSSLEGFLNLDDVFSDADGDPLTFEILRVGDPSLVSAAIENASVNLSFPSPAKGAAVISVIARDAKNDFAIADFTFSIYDTASANRAEYRLASASSTERPGLRPSFAVDGDPTTRWSSEYSDAEWFAVHFEKTRTIGKVVLHWEAAYGRAYDVQISHDGETWETVESVASGDGQTDEFIFDPPLEAAHLRMAGLERGTEWGYSLFEFEAFGPEPQATSIEQSIETKRISVYPTFCVDKTVHYKVASGASLRPEGYSLKIFSMTGALAGRFPILRPQGSIDISSLQPGIYLVAFNAGDSVYRNWLVIPQ